MSIAYKSEEEDNLSGVTINTKKALEDVMAMFNSPLEDNNYSQSGEEECTFVIKYDDDSNENFRFFFFIIIIIII